MAFTYLASPYTHADHQVRISRFRLARRATAMFVRAGFPIYSPIVHGHTVETDLEGWDKGDEHEFWMAQSLPILLSSSRMMILSLSGWDDSRGVQREIRVARENGIPVACLDPNLTQWSTDEAITYLRDFCPRHPPAPGIRPAEVARADGVNPSAWPDAPSSRPR